MIMIVVIIDRDILNQVVMIQGQRVGGGKGQGQEKEGGPDPEKEGDQEKGIGQGQDQGRKGHGQRKGFHHLPSYATDVEKVVKDLLEQHVLQKVENRKLNVKLTGLDRNPFSNCSVGLSTMLHRHRPWSPYGRLRDCKF